MRILFFSFIGIVIGNFTSAGVSIIVDAIHNLISDIPWTSKDFKAEKNSQETDQMLFIIISILVIASMVAGMVVYSNTQSNLKVVQSAAMTALLIGVTAQMDYKLAYSRRYKRIRRNREK
ncbi:hypothetical protein [Nicoliella lavandulae]|uniref:Uncharacterized protein n=1 Tax=Nicoliella lavandulae TaxID=3082954 RepID=A0ABU8SMG3_9LACO